MKIDFTNLSRQYQAYKTSIDTEIQQVLNHSSYIMGESVSRLEEKLKAQCGAPYAIGCSSGTDALLLVLMALGIKSGDEVITSPFTFIASSEVIAFLGARPVFVDIDEKTYNLNPDLIEEKITSKTKAILAVSLYGQPVDMQTLNQIATKHNLVLIEDGAQSFGASLGAKKSCNLSEFATTSFFPSKPLGCYGDGGAVFCQNEEMASKIRSLLSHGQKRRYEHQYIGINARLDSIQAGILCAKIEGLNQEIKRRNEVAEHYSATLKGAITPFVALGCQSAFAQYSVRVQRREEMIEHLASHQIPTAIHYPKPLHLQEAFVYLGYKRGDFPIAERVSNEILSLPMNAFITKEEQDHIIEVFNQKA